MSVEQEAFEIASGLARAAEHFMKSPAYKAWRRDQYIRAALTGSLANPNTHCRNDAAFPEFCEIVGKVATEIADATISAADVVQS